MKIFYDEEGDLLEVQFKLGVADMRTGISLTSQITIFCDVTLQQPLGLTVLAYSKLLAYGEFVMDEWDRIPPKMQLQVKLLIARYPLNRFLHLANDKIKLEDVKISELANQ